MVERRKPAVLPPPAAAPGRPSTYDPKYARIAQQLCSHGATDVDLADAFLVTVTTIKNWMAHFPEFRDAVRYGKAEVFDPQVERALAQRALGYSVDTEEIKVTKDGDVLRIPVRKHYPPDTTACIFWLKNRNPAQWRDVHEHKHEGTVNSLSAEQLLEVIRKDAQELGIPLSDLKAATEALLPGTATFTGKTKH